jgi:hypothetical protein
MCNTLFQKLGYKIVRQLWSLERLLMNITSLSSLPVRQRIHSRWRVGNSPLWCSWRKLQVWILCRSGREFILGGG